MKQKEVFINILSDENGITMRSPSGKSLTFLKSNLLRLEYMELQFMNGIKNKSGMSFFVPIDTMELFKKLCEKFE